MQGREFGQPMSWVQVPNVPHGTPSLLRWTRSDTNVAG